MNNFCYSEQEKNALCLGGNWVPNIQEQSCSSAYACQRPPNAEIRLNGSVWLHILFVKEMVSFHKNGSILSFVIDKVWHYHLEII